MNTYVRWMCVRGLLTAAFGAVAGFLPLGAWGLGTEAFNNKNLCETNYAACKGLWSVIDRDCMVYTSWVNGDEHFYYKGGIEELNNALEGLSAVEADVHEVLLRPGPGGAKTFDGKGIPCDWSVHYLGGIAAAATASEIGLDAPELCPTMTIFTGAGGIDPGALRIPDGVSITRVADDPPRLDKVFPFEATHEGKRFYVPDVLPHVRITLLELDRVGGAGGSFHLVGDLKPAGVSDLDKIPEFLTVRVTFYDERGRVLLQKQSFQTPRASQKWTDENVNESGLRSVFVPQFAFDLDPNDMGAKTFRLEVAEARNLEFRPIEEIVREIGADTLRQAAIATIYRHVRSAQDGQDKIAPASWAEPIRRLDPIRVSNSFANVMIALRSSGGVEEGIYICMLISSFRPSEDGTMDGVTYHRVSDDVFAYTRAIEQ
jgi:hypothetical protein